MATYSKKSSFAFGSLDPYNEPFTILCTHSFGTMYALLLLRVCHGKKNITRIKVARSS